MVSNYSMASSIAGSCLLEYLSVVHSMNNQHLAILLGIPQPVIPQVVMPDLLHDNSRFGIDRR